MRPLTLEIRERAKNHESVEISVRLREEDVDSSSEFKTVVPHSAGDWGLLSLAWESPSESSPSPKPEPSPSAGLGVKMFEAVFAGESGRSVWSRVRERLAETFIEIHTESGLEGPWIPWELLRNPETGEPLSANAAGFSRRLGPTGESLSDEPQEGGAFRALVVICRPAVERDIPFESIARRLIDSLQGRTRKGSPAIVFDVLRPPTFGRLSSLLLEAEALDEPYHLVHFDVAIVPDSDSIGGKLLPLAAVSGAHEAPPALIALDDPREDWGLQLVDPASLGELAADARVGLLSLYAASPSAAVSSGDDPWQTCDAAARRLLAAGAGSVALWPLHVDPDHASHALSLLVQRLAGGERIGQVFSEIRSAFYSRNSQGEGQTLGDDQEWMLPLLYGSAARRLIRPVTAGPSQSAEISAPAPAPYGKSNDSAVTLAENQLPARSSYGFHGRDGALALLDRALPTHTGLVLVGEAGIGKTAAAVEFGRWLMRTGGLDGPLLFDSFQSHRPLSALLDRLAGVFRDSLEKAGYSWDVLSFPQRYQTALHVLRQIPVLWIWDGLENVRTGAEHGMLGPETWSPDDIAQLNRFLVDAADSQARFLITTRRSVDWLDSPHFEINMGGLSGKDTLEIIRGIVRERGGSWEGAAAWKPLLDLSRGNPLAVRALTVQALEESGGRAKELTRLAEAVRGQIGSAEADAEMSPALAATISYALHNGFSEAELELLALLHLFRRTVSVDVLDRMADKQAGWGLDELRSLKEFEKLLKGSEASVLDRAVALGLLQQEGDGRYAIEPAVRFVLRRLFEERYSAAKPTTLREQMASRAKTVTVTGRFARTGAAPVLLNVAQATEEDAPRQAKGNGHSPWLHGRSRAVTAYTEAFAAAAAEAFQAVEVGNLEPLDWLQMHEDNLRHALLLARNEKNWRAATALSQGLAALYEASDQTTVWKSLCDDLAPDCTIADGEQAIEGAELYWRAITDQRVRLSRRRQSLSLAFELQALLVKWDRAQCPATQSGGDEDDQAQRDARLLLAKSLYRWSEIGRDNAKPIYRVEEEAIQIRERIGDNTGAAEWAFELGAHYTEVNSIRDLAHAERWLRKALELEQGNPIGQARCLAALGRVAWERFLYARQGDRPEGELLRHLNDARNYYQRALEHDPPDDWDSLASHNQQFGHISYTLGDIDRALPHYRESIRYDELQGNAFGAAQTRFNLGIALRDVDRLGEARKYAVAAEEQFALLGAGVRHMHERSAKLVHNIDQRLNKKRRHRHRNGT